MKSTKEQSGAVKTNDAFEDQGAPHEDSKVEKGGSTKKNNSKGKKEEAITLVRVIGELLADRNALAISQGAPRGGGSPSRPDFPM